MSRHKFQFTPLREGRPELGRDILMMETISIHAPARGATAWTMRFASLVTNFNSRPCERGDPTPSPSWKNTSYFNSRPCERGYGKIKQN